MMPAGAPALIELRGITKTFGTGQAAFQALRGIDLAVEAGEFVAVMGPSGSGKSTAMNIIGCLDTPTTGEYLFRGIHVERLERNQRALLRRHCLGFVFQGFNLLARTSALENVELPLLYRGVGVPPRRAAARAPRSPASGWPDGRHTHRPNCPAASSSASRSPAPFVTQPIVLLADEPTGNLDSKRGHEIMALLGALNRDQGITIIMVTHELDMVKYAGRVVQFVDGMVARDERPEAGA